MTTLEKLEEIVDTHWPGFLEYSEIPPEERERFKRPISMEDLMTLAKEAYNLAIEDAADNADADYTRIHHHVLGEDVEVYVIKDSILKLKIQ